MCVCGGGGESREIADRKSSGYQSPQKKTCKK